MVYKTEILVRSYELDSYNHVNNAVYQNYLEHARMDFLNQIGFRYKEFYDAGYFLFITHVDIFYKSPAVLNDRLTVETSVKNIKLVRGSFHQTIKREDGTVCVEADVDWACITKEGRPSKIPDEFMLDALKPDSSV